MTQQEIQEYYSNLLIRQFKNSPKAKATIQALVNCNLCDGLVQALQTCFNLDTAYGNQLTIIGKLVGIPRNIYGLDLEHTFFTFQNYDETNDGVGFKLYTDPEDLYLFQRYISNAIYTLTDFELKILIRMKIFYNNNPSSLKYIKENLYSITEGGIDITDNFSRSEIDAYTKSVSSFDGTDEDQSYTDPIAGEATFYGTAKLSAAEKKFGATSLLLDGDSDYITYTDSSSWDLWNSDTTIDFWMRMTTVASGVYTVISQYQDSVNTWFVFIRTDLGKIQLRGVMGGAAKYDYQGTFVPEADTWYHIAIVKHSSSFLMFVNGFSVSVSEVSAWSAPSALSGALLIGSQSGSAYFFPGYIDELRVSQGIARWTSNFTPPSTPYTSGITMSVTFNVFQPYYNSMIVANYLNLLPKPMGVNADINYN